ncbi:class I SAM-dependent methyltransferase [Nocardia zapadnayensis]|uniref:class I SAM-dependent methyltransferase n=1 Tax=Nocardia rhamnosiphila TaxID=426716 RepID=UPI002246E910|nr:class I SAM-dependent methyltransferase [Nocardia zapadnayensis]MCX0269159.1 class I SAM-dependent methyltransferase [Nocardia zapadnayensis]
MTQSHSDPVTDAFFALHHNLPRQGPGSDETTRHLLRLAGHGRPGSRVLDVGCGPGRAALLLAAETGAHVVAVDLHQPFLDELADTAAQQDLTERISMVNCSMDQLPFPDHSFDTIWAEGSVYNIGFDTALRTWHRLLSPDGVLVVTEIEWSTTTPAPPVRAFWADSYPLRTAEENTAAAQSHGYRVSAHHPLPESDWWDEYYTPLSERLDAADPTRPGMAEAISAQREEITLRREHGCGYRYAGYILHPAPES